MRFFAFPIQPSIELLRADEGEEKPKFRTTVCVLWFPSSPRFECWNITRICVMPSCPARPGISYWLFPIVSSRFLRICLQICKGQININYMLNICHSTSFGWGQAGGVAWSTPLISITLTNHNLSHFTGRNMLVLSLGATRKESKNWKQKGPDFYC